MQIIDIIMMEDVIDKLIWKHNVSEIEVRQVFNNQPQIRLIERGRVKGENLYVAGGETDGGRYLLVFFILKKSKKALIVAARDMTDSERRRYEKR